MWHMKTSQANKTTLIHSNELIDCYLNYTIWPQLAVKIDIPLTPKRQANDRKAPIAASFMHHFALNYRLPLGTPSGKILQVKCRLVGEGAVPNLQYQHPHFPLPRDGRAR